MSYNNVDAPYADHIEQQNWLRGHGQPASADLGPRRRFPLEQPFIEYDPVVRGWFQYGKRKSNFRPNHYFTRPNDGKRSGAWGRLKDALTGEGADVFITTSGDKRTLIRDRPQKWQWTGWPMEPGQMLDWWSDPDHRLQDEMPVWNTSWTNTSSRMGAQYNFRTRRYEPPRAWWLTTSGESGPNAGVWRDAQWRRHAKRSDVRPYDYQTPDGEWYSRVPNDAGQFAGGRPRR